MMTRRFGFLFALFLAIGIYFCSAIALAADPLEATESVKPKEMGKGKVSGKNQEATKAKEVPKPKSNSNILDFEADVIEGERVAPNLFVQMDLGAPKMDTLMFQRKNFNDFHAIDMKRKPKYRSRGK